jgi:hypothetical protein
LHAIKGPSIINPRAARNRRTLIAINPRLATLGAGILVALIAARSVGLFGGASPFLLAPAPLIFVLLAAVDVPSPLIPVLFAGLFWLFSLQLFRGEAAVPKRTFVLVVVAGVWSVAGFIIGWDFGVRYQGRAYTLICLLVSACMLTVSAIMLRRARMHPSFNLSLISHTIAFAWLGSYAFPYLGELP